MTTPITPLLKSLLDAWDELCEIANNMSTYLSTTIRDLITQANADSGMAGWLQKFIAWLTEHSEALNVSLLEFLFGFFVTFVGITLVRWAINLI